MSFYYFHKTGYHFDVLIGSGIMVANKTGILHFNRFNFLF